MVSSRSSTAWKEVGEREGTMLVGPCTGDLCLPIWSSSLPSPCCSVIPEAASTNGIKPSGFQLCSDNGRPEQDQRTGGERSPSVSSQVPSPPDSFGDGCISPPTRGHGSCGNTLPQSYNCSLLRLLVATSSFCPGAGMTPRVARLGLD